MNKRAMSVVRSDFNRRLGRLTAMVVKQINEDSSGSYANEQEELEKLVYLRLADLMIDLGLDPEVSKTDG